MSAAEDETYLRWRRKQNYQVGGDHEACEPYEYCLAEKELLAHGPRRSSWISEIMVPPAIQPLSHT